MSLQKILAGSALVVAVLALYLSLQSPLDTKALLERVSELVESRLGAFPGPDINSPYLSVNGVEKWYNTKSLNTATTTPCAIRSPLSATSTLAAASLRISTGTTTETAWTAARATTAFATTSVLTEYTLVSGVQGVMVATTSPTHTSVGKVDADNVFGPGQWLVWGVKNIANLTTDKLLGTCTATFEKI